MAALLQPAVPSIRTVEKGDRSAIEDALQTVIRTQEDWTSLWRRHAPGRPAPSIDFAREMAVAVFLGSRPSAGFSVEIVSLGNEQGSFVVRYREQVPAGDAITAQVLTSPFHIVAVPKAAGEPRFLRVPN